jgi:broad specificity phosphatase PhoE
MSIVHFVTHPDVVIDPAIPVRDWPLSPVGVHRMQAAVRQPWVASVRSVFSSAERKAMDAVSVLAGHLGLNPVVVDTLGENDRSATGYLARDEFEATADEFFARPDESIRGWERAADAQRRIVSAVEQVITLSDASGDIAMLAHGGVGALLLCHLKGVPISRTEDQPIGGGGNFFSFDAAGRRLLSGWRPIDG